MLLFSKRSAAFLPRGTTRTPGADPTRLPIGLDPRAVSIAEGIRAGLAAALPMAASVWLDQPTLSLAALGALLTCIVDPGGKLRRRLPMLLGFVGGGGVLLGGFGLVRDCGAAVTVLAALPVLFATGFLRVWGAPAAAMGNLLAVVALLGTDEARSLAGAADVAGLFAAGGLWALLLTLALWRIHPFGPARRAVADVWDALAQHVRMLQRLLAEEMAGGAHSEAGWDAQARAGRGAVRSAIERARSVLMDTADRSGAASGPGVQNLVRLEAADQVFAVLIAIADRLESAAPGERPCAAILLRRLRPLLRVVAQDTEREAAARLAKLERAIAALEQGAADSTALAGLAHAMAERLRVALRLIDPAQYLPGSGAQGEAGLSWRQRLAAPAAANWTWSSVTLRHAVRVAAVTSVALGGTLLRHGPYTHWLTITLVLVMQPFFATTWQRTLERVGGTLLGGAAAAAVSALLQTRVLLAALLPVLGALALAVRQVSYGVYIVVYTPVVILLVEQTHPRGDQAGIALARALYTVLGGLIAVAANATLWPVWQPEQVARDLATAIAAHAAYARAVLLPDGTDPARQRRHAGLASNNLEASLQRAMHEPRRGQRDRLQAILVADAMLRRIAGRLTAMSLEPPVGQQTLAAWIVDALQAVPGGRSPASRPAGGETGLRQVAQQVDMLAMTLAREGRQP